MRLLATLGALKINTKQKYIYDGRAYEEYFSFLALQKALGIASEDTYVIGTSETLGLLQEKCGDDKTLLRNFQEVDGGIAIDDFFSLCMRLMEKDTYLDVTQGFRHMPMTLLLSSITAANFEDKNIKDIFYAKTLDSSCSPSSAVCTFEFYSMLLYLDMASIATSIDSFCASYSTPALKVSYPKFVSLYASLDELSRHLVGNNLTYAIELAKKTKSKIEPLRQSPLSPLLPKLEDEIDFLISLETKKEHERFFEGAKRYFQKELLLNSVTTLFEAVTAFLDYLVTKEELSFAYRDFRSGKQTICKEQKGKYKRRNCQKKALKAFVDKNKTHPIVNQAFERQLDELDKMRNLSAHAFIDEKSSDDYKTKLQNKIIFFEKLIKR
ncbi:MAG: hypothetical protein GXX07_00915 [Wolinella succinogenes]|uniref:TM1812 family CRISPR-associated protein n=1 Tax=Wolinella succinogenes TaxID=844 RepID=UPI0016AAA44D|nr:TM1812 family CRISPR-associated protein [Wolinella succinogenes]NLU33504.1 hypothetical protein [Wolinella succinogenes]